MNMNTETMNVNKKKYPVHQGSFWWHFAPNQVAHVIIQPSYPVSILQLQTEWFWLLRSPSSSVWEKYYLTKTFLFISAQQCLQFLKIKCSIYVCVFYFDSWWSHQYIRHKNVSACTKLPCMDTGYWVISLVYKLKKATFDNASTTYWYKHFWTIIYVIWHPVQCSP